MLKKANDILHCAVKGISDVIMEEGLINLDFADVRAVMSEAGLALMGTGVSSAGENRAREATMRAITSPLLEDVSIDGAKAVLYNITASREITVDEVEEIGTIIADAVHPEVNAFVGVVYDDNAGDELRITVIATGIDAAPRPVSPGLGQAAHPPAGNVTPFSAAGKYPSGREQATLAPQLPMQAPLLNAAPTGGVPRQKRLVETWHDEKSEAPSFVRKEQARGRPKAHAPGEEDFIYEEGEFEVPAFIRKQAD
jgi:cell division protein FtsZ